MNLSKITNLFNKMKHNKKTYVVSTSLGDILIYKLNQNTYNYYKNNVKDREDISFSDARKVLSRNIFLCKETLRRKYISNIKDMADTYRYGNLLIAVKDDTIVYVKNRKGKYNYDLFNLKRKEVLNKEMSIK